MGSISFISTIYRPSEEEAKRLEEIQMSIAKCRRNILSECYQGANPEYWVVARVESLAAKMRDKMKIEAVKND